MSTAILSADRMYRYRLDRERGGSGPPVGFCLHNPSTADEDNDDPTLRRGMGFADRWNASRLIFVNAWAFRATKPADLWNAGDPVGEFNDSYIRVVSRLLADAGGFMVAAWGAVNPPMAYRETAKLRLWNVEKTIRDEGCVIKHLGLTIHGFPRHPLYVRGDTVPVPWP